MIERNEKMNLYDQLLSLQEIPNAYRLWTEYRENLTEYIIKQLEGEPQSVLILGGGRSNDIDLKRLMPYVTHLTLWDKEEKAIHEARLKYDLVDHHKVSIVREDLLGIAANDYRFYAEALVQTVRKKGMNTSLEELSVVARTGIQKLEQKISVVDFKEKQYDTIIMIGLHSQLFSMMDWIWQAILQTLGKEEIQVRNYIKGLNEIVIPKLHEHMIKATRKQWIMGCEIGRIGREGAIEGAYQGLRDLEQLRQNGLLQKKSEQQLIWPFEPSKEVFYEMLIQCDKVIY